jgi:hypothetical protein
MFSLCYLFILIFSCCLCVNYYSSDGSDPCTMHRQQGWFLLLSIICMEDTKTEVNQSSFLCLESQFVLRTSYHWLMDDLDVTCCLLNTRIPQCTESMPCIWSSFAYKPTTVSIATKLHFSFLSISLHVMSQCESKEELTVLMDSAATIYCSWAWCQCFDGGSYWYGTRAAQLRAM